MIEKGMLGSFFFVFYGIDRQDIWLRVHCNLAEKSSFVLIFQ